MENVHGPALALDKPLRQLSLGWSRGLGGLCAALWAVSLQSLTNALNRDRALAFVPGAKNAFLESHVYTQKRSCNQDRLGTNIGKVAKQGLVSCVQFMARVSTASAS